MVLMFVATLFITVLSFIRVEPLFSSLWAEYGLMTAEMVVLYEVLQKLVQV